MSEHEFNTVAAYDEAFAERVAAPLREAEQLSGDFGARVMDAVRVEARVRRSVASRTPTPPRALEPPDVPLAPPAPAWWRRERALRVTPLGAIAMAAGLLIAAALGAYGALRLGLPPAVARNIAVAPIAAPSDSSRALVGATDTVHVVRFVFVDSSAQTVSLVGDFNAWSRESTPLLRDAASGVWTATVALPSGRHEYAFIVNGERWVADPFAARVRDEFEADYSVVTVGDRRS